MDLDLNTPSEVLFLPPLLFEKEHLILFSIHFGKLLLEEVPKNTINT